MLVNYIGQVYVAIYSKFQIVDISYMLYPPSGLTWIANVRDLLSAWLTGYFLAASFDDLGLHGGP
jgi:hypothetical protein